MNDGTRTLSGPAAASTPSSSELPSTEFVGASDETIAEAVRRALAHAARALRTLEGVGVLIVPQIYRQGSAPRFRVTLKVTPSAHPRRGAAAPNGNGR